jgi:hypothetical protein
LRGPTKFEKRREEKRREEKRDDKKRKRRLYNYYTVFSSLLFYKNRMRL